MTARILVVDDIEPDHVVPAFEQGLGGVKADKAGIAGHEDCHVRSP